MHSPTNSQSPPASAERLIDTTSSILHVLTGDLGKNAHTAALELASTIDGLSTSSQIPVGLLSSACHELNAAQEAAQTSSADVGESVGLAKDMLPLLSELLVEAESMQKRIGRVDVKVEERNARYVAEMHRRNDAFEKKLRQDHEEFSRMHAQRLADVLRHQL
ncbi:hypothetical protein BX070DRAFT_229474 [Coemansia spiralis]|nr:hypothetical protein BX070DRAFT_229474 [Coemansia spiralis]